MQAPEAFVDQLDREFMNTLRIRWSYKDSEWHLEEKVGRAAVPPIRIAPWEDDLIRARDGYAYVMTVRTGDRMPCPNCNATIKVPIMETAQARCERCIAKGRNGRFTAAYFPLNHILIDYLRRIHRTRRTAKEAAAEADRNNALRDQRMMRDYYNKQFDITSDHWNRLTERVSVGYTGRQLVA